MTYVVHKRYRWYRFLFEWFGYSPGWLGKLTESKNYFNFYRNNRGQEFMVDKESGKIWQKT